ncbi:MAG TPA: OmpW family outer membrane protein [Ideonella sp.]|nr:OmpW family outer membrane protein [Ideonella sp.]
MNRTLCALAVGAALTTGALAQTEPLNWTVKAGLARYTTKQTNNGLVGIGVPPGADVHTGDANTLIFEVERRITPHVGVELGLGLPPTINTVATGSVAFLGKVMSTKNVSPTLFVNWHFGDEGAKWRPYLGAGINYTRFVGIESTLGQVSLSDSVGPAAKGGISYTLSRQWAVFASVTVIQTKTDLVAKSSTVITSTLDLRPIIYTLGAAYSF